MKGNCFCKYTPCLEISVSFRSLFILEVFLSCRNKSFTEGAKYFRCLNAEFRMIVKSLKKEEIFLPISNSFPSDHSFAVEKFYF